MAMDAHQRKLFQGAAATYAWIIPALQKAGRKLGYAVAVHGSLARDLDLVAVPWTNQAVSARKLAEDFHRRLGGRLTKGTRRPHGRVSYAIVLDRSHFYVDLAVMPRRPQRRRRSQLRP
jgi:hypothetical protein